MRLAGRPRSGGNRFGLWLAGGAVISAIVGWSIYSFLNAAAPTEAVLVATRDIPAYSAVQPNDFTTEMRPRVAVPEDALRDRSGVGGMVAQGALLKGDVVRAGHLTKQQGSPLSAKLSLTPDLRVISLTPESMEGLQSQVSVGDQIDVLGVMQVSNGKVNEARIGVLAPNAKVVAIATPQKESGLGGTQAATVLVAVTPEQAQKIKLSQATGKVFVQLSVSKTTPPPVMTPETVLGR